MKSGVGDIAFSGGVTFSASGNMTINTGGTVTLAGTGACQFNNATFNGNLIIANPIRVDFNTATFGGSGQIKVQNPGVVGTALTLISNSSGYSGGGTLNVGIALNSLGLPFTKSDVTRAPFAPPASNSFITAIGGTKDNFTAILTIGGVIDGYSDVIFTAEAILSAVRARKKTGHLIPQFLRYLVIVKKINDPNLNPQYPNGLSPVVGLAGIAELDFLLD